ncbi:2-methylcitrate dehydratase [Streptomyces antnestii]|uniref:2-methylcitrate dehydratase n=1 Tax=Streptomyces antnestii TaxID=2494256 RepID=A0A437Q2Y8_9ACTN|nr:MmgE/PrpD family protein [Streptomyces sp. San01]RVU28850.1 2-methylcitrate dehydratase [Streptomyces sp. San01]
MPAIAESLAEWAYGYEPDPEDLALARRSLLDTVAVTLAARDHPVSALAAELPDAARWAAVGHVLDFDDLHIESTTHISVVIVPAVLAAGGDARAYLAGAGVMARLGALLGWSHYAAGWHATCTAGAPAAAVAAGVARGLTPRQLATAMALAVPGASGVQAAFGTHSKSLQVGFAAEAGVRAARLARAGATADPRAVDAWLELVGAQGAAPQTGGPAVPGGLAIKMFPCCYAMQRPIAALRDLRVACGPDDVAAVRVTTPGATIHPLIHDDPGTGLEAKFSLPYAVATALLDGFPGFSAFTDDAVRRPEARRLMATVETERTEGGAGLLDGEVDLAVTLTDGRVLRSSLAHPPGSPERPPTEAELAEKFAACGSDVPARLKDATWESARALLLAELPGKASA